MLKCSSGKIHEKNVNYDVLLMLLSYCFQFRKLFSFLIHDVPLDYLILLVSQDPTLSKVILRNLILFYLFSFIRKLYLAASFLV